MITMSQEMLDRLTRAAELRALGAGWPAVADQLGEKVEVVRAWTLEYLGDWEFLLRRARQEALDAAIGEAYQVLLNGMRSQDERIRHESAKIVERCLARRKRKQKAHSDSAVKQRQARSRLQE